MTCTGQATANHRFQSAPIPARAIISSKLCAHSIFVFPLSWYGYDVDRYLDLLSLSRPR
jgi:hypothetical protein